MGMFDSAKDKMQSMTGQGEGQGEGTAEQGSGPMEGISDAGIERAGDMVDDRTGGTFASQVDTGQRLADARIGGGGDASGSGPLAGLTGTDTSATGDGGLPGVDEGTDGAGSEGASFPG